MKIFHSICAVLATVICLASAASAAEKYFVVKVTDLTKEMKYDVLSQEDLKALENQIKEEARLWSRAETAAMKEWLTNEQYKGKAWPKGAISQRTVKTVGQPFPDESKAEDKLSKIEENEAEKIADEEEKAKKAPPKPGKDKEKGNAERDNMYAMARAIFEQKLTEVKEADTKAKAEKAGGGEAAAPAAPAAPKEGEAAKAE